MTLSPMTREALRKALVAKGVLLKDYGSAQIVGEAIATRGLTEAIAGKHDGHSIKFGRAFELIYGQRLTLSRDGR